MLISKKRNQNTDPIRSYKKGITAIISCAIAFTELTLISPVIAQIKQDLPNSVIPEKITQRSLSRRLKAIIRLAHTKLPPPTTTGTGRLSLEPLQDGIAWTIDIKIGDFGYSLNKLKPIMKKYFYIGTSAWMVTRLEI